MLQDATVHSSLVQMILAELKQPKVQGEVWQAWNEALLAAAPYMDKATAERQVLAYATARALRRDESTSGRLAGCRMVPAALPAIKSDQNVILCLSMLLCLSHALISIIYKITLMIEYPVYECVFH
jgi:hypothetical protein